jgi:hypothetical protein
MCLAVYIASDVELPLVPWNDAKPSFYVKELIYNKGVRKQFSFPNVRYVGSNAGCGCGFLKDGVVGEELVEALENYAGLAAYVLKLRDRGADIQVFSCWEGDQEKKQDSRNIIRVTDLLADDFEFKEKALYVIE